ncbi:hypothetical protein SAMN02910292_03018 [Lachnospiraceae bacterium XBB2008]|nr:hypothetical protein SAMN02910292_03018 [Lachnospiraceae bacterium XBB2008]
MSKEKETNINPTENTHDCNDVKVSIYDLIEEGIMDSNLPAEEKTSKLSRLMVLKNKPVNALLVGPTGSGKSSTICAAFGRNVAKVGVGVDPTTEYIECYHLDNLILWDSPGLGEGLDDRRYKLELINKMNSLDQDGQPLIDLVILVADAASKDLGTSYELINTILKPCLGEEAEQRIIVALNRSDIAMSGRHWDVERNEPDEVLLAFLENKVESVSQRILETTGLHLMPIYYSAGYVEGDDEVRHPYNLTKLIYMILSRLPSGKRLAIYDQLDTSNSEHWCYNDDNLDYQEQTRQSFLEALSEFVSEGAARGAEIGENLLGVPGKLLGTVLGTFFSGAVFSIKALFGKI